MVGGKYEAGGIAKDGAKMVTAVGDGERAEVHRPDRRQRSALAITACAGGPIQPALFVELAEQRGSASWAGSRPRASSPPSSRDGIETKGGEWSAEDEADLQGPDPRPL